MEESEVLEPLHTLTRELLELEKSGMAKTLVYTDRDVTAAALVFSHVMGNRLIDTLKTEHASIGLSQHLAQTYGEAIYLLTKQMTGVDISSNKNDKG